MHIVTDNIHPNEPAYGIFEGPKLRSQSDGSSGYRWIQQVWVIRGDTIARYETDFGPAEDFKTVTPLAMPSEGDDTVAELQFWAEKNRHDDYWYKRSLELQAESTMMKDAANQILEIEEARKNRSVLGPYQTTQRNGYAAGLQSKLLKERREERTGRKTFYGYR